MTPARGYGRPTAANSVAPIGDVTIHGTVALPLLHLARDEYSATDSHLLLKYSYEDTVVKFLRHSGRCDENSYPTKVHIE